MKKIAIFVEGLTEERLVIKLLTACAGSRGITFEVARQHRGSLHTTELISANPHAFYVLVANCCNDGQVKSQIVDQYQSLVSAGYDVIIGLRDVYPNTLQELPLVEKFLNIGLPTGAVSIELHLAVMEVEAWFIDELTHYARLDASMTPNAILAKGFAIESTPSEDWAHPAETLDQIYKHWNLRYTKKRNRIQRTIDAIDDTELYVNVRTRCPSLDKFLKSIDNSMH